VTIAVRDLIAVGSIAKAFGIKGEVIVEPLTAMPERFRSLHNVYLASELSATGVNDSEPVMAEVTAVFNVKCLIFNGGRSRAHRINSALSIKH